MRRKVFTDSDGKLIYRVSPGNYEFVDRAQMNQGAQMQVDQALLDQLAGMGATGAEVDLVADISALLQELTATDTVRPTVRFVELTHASVIIEAAMVAPTNCLMSIKNTSSGGSAAHTFTVSAGTLDGSATIATLDAPDEHLFVYFDSNGDGTVVENVGTIILS